MGNNQTNRHLIEKKQQFVVFVNKEEYVDNNSNLLFFQSTKIASNGTSITFKSIQNAIIIIQIVIHNYSNIDANKGNLGPLNSNLGAIKTL